jgi:glutathione S-transferase
MRVLIFFVAGWLWAQPLDWRPVMRAALDRMERALSADAWLAGGTEATLADLALVAYTRVAHEGGFELSPYPAIRDWIGRTEAVFGIRPQAGPCRR